MSGVPWFPFYASDFLAGVADLSASETGVYIVLLALMYDEGGPIPRDEPRLARRCGIAKPQFSRVLANLLAQGKINEEAGQLSNKRVEVELSKRDARTVTASRSAQLRWRKNVLNQSSGRADASFSHTQTPCNGDAARARPTATTTGSPTEIKDHTLVCWDPLSPAPRRARRSKARSEIAEDAKPSSQDREAAKDAGLDGAAFRAEWLRFRDHHRAKGSVMADWAAAWRSWLGNMDRFQMARAGLAARLRRDPVLYAANELLGQYGKDEGADNANRLPAIGGYEPPIEIENGR